MNLPRAAAPPTDPNRFDVLILGAGLTGLCVARELGGRGLRVALVEKEAEAGGLARSVDWKGARLDLGGHRIFFHDDALLADVVALVGRDGLLKHRKRSSVYRDGRFLKYPPELRNSLASAALLARIAWQALARRGAGAASGSLKDWILAHFGPAVHDAYFEEYTRKVWGLDTDEMSAVWAERRIGRLSALGLLRGLVCGTRNKEATSEFHYPRDGIGAVCARLRDGLGAGVEVLCGAEAAAITGEGGRPSRARVKGACGERVLAFDRLVSTIPLTSLARALAPARPELEPLAAHVRYRDLAIVYLEVARRPVFDAHWVYFPESAVPFARVCELDNWSERAAPPSRAVLCCELFCERGDSVWNQGDAELRALVAGALAERGFAREDEVLDALVVRVPHAYPLLYRGYEVSLEPLRAACARVPGLSLAGRTGTHSYFDMEECFVDARRAAREVAESLRASAAAA